MIFKETAVFTERVGRLLSDEEYRLLQTRLIQDPDAGSVIPGSGGLRKIRWAAEGSGKRGGTRILYYWAVSDETILLLFAFAKNERDDLTRPQLQQLADLIRKEYP